MTNRISLHNVENVKISESSVPKHSEKKQDITIEQGNGDDLEVRLFGDFEVESDSDLRQQDEALEDALKHLGQVIGALQDAGWSNSEIQPVERLMVDVKGQTEGGQ